MKSGFIALLGKPNVGKSSLMNRLIGEEVSIVSPKPQTTRDNIKGILTNDEYQMIFVDTPGIHKPKTELGKFMGSVWDNAAKSVDVLILVLDGAKKVSDEDLLFIEGKLKLNLPTYVVVNKVDLAGYERIYPILQKLACYMSSDENPNGIKEIIPTSCESGVNIDTLRDKIASELTDENIYYPVLDLSDRPVRFHVGEQIRKSTLLYLQEEIPHGIGIAINLYEELDDLITVEADIICEKAGHKRIIIGDKGCMIKKIGSGARLALEKRLKKRVFIRLFVKVREDWRNKKNYLRELGYES